MLPEPHFPNVVDNSQRKDFVSCPRKWYNSTILSLKSNIPNVHLNAGAAFAKGLEMTRRAFHDGGMAPDDAIAVGLKELTAAYGDFDAGDDAPKSLPRMQGALVSYFDMYPLATDVLKPARMPDGTLAVEFSGVIELPIRHPETGDPLLYGGRFDMLALRDGVLFVEDDKTASQLGPTWSKKWDLNCFATGTELYTMSGWKPIEQIQENEAVAQYAHDGSLSFAAATNVHSTPYVGEMISIVGQKIAQRVTPNHRILLQKRRGGSIIIQASELSAQDTKHAIPVAGMFHGPKLPKALQCYLAMVQADGHLQTSRGEIDNGRGHREHTPHPSVTLSFTKDRKIQRCRDILTELDVTFSFTAPGRFYISGFEDVQAHAMRYLSVDKEFLSGQEYLFDHTFLQELQYWDGWGTQYYTISENNARFVQTVAHLNGYYCSVHEKITHTRSFVVLLSPAKSPQLASLTISKNQNQDSYVHCVSVPTGFLLIRFQGKVSISGNSQFTGYCHIAKQYGFPVAGAVIRGVSILKTSYGHAQAITYRPQWQIDRWWQQLICDVTRMVEAFEQAHYDFDLSDSCSSYGGCPFLRLCSVEDPEPWIEAEFRVEPHRPYEGASE